MPQATPSMLGVVACRRTMSSSTSNGALLLPHVVFTTKSIDEMRTFGTRSLPVTWDGLGTRYRALGDVLREASSCRSSSTRSRGRGFCPDPSDRLRPQDFRPSVTSRTAGKARARRLAIACRAISCIEILRNIVDRLFLFLGLSGVFCLLVIWCYLVLSTQ